LYKEQLVEETNVETMTEDFRAAKAFCSDPSAVFAALTDVDALTAWWTPAAGGAATGDTLRFLMGDSEVVMHVDEAAEPSTVRWSVLVCEPEEDWVGTSISYEIAPSGSGSELSFRHHGLTPRLRCFDQCHAGWTHFLASLVDHVDHGGGTPNLPADAERCAAWRARHAVA
jgi:uncharacterized protein YndB with AHSA1/START domain